MRHWPKLGFHPMQKEEMIRFQLLVTTRSGMHLVNDTSSVFGKQAFVSPLASGRRVPALSIMHSLQSLTHFLFAACKMSQSPAGKGEAGGQNGIVEIQSLGVGWGWKSNLGKAVASPFSSCRGAETPLRYVFGDQTQDQKNPLSCVLSMPRLSENMRTRA